MCFFLCYYIIEAWFNTILYDFILIYFMNKIRGKAREI